MNQKIYPSRYKDMEAVTIESEKLLVQFLPGMGAKMASLIYKPAAYEFLVQRPGDTYRRQPFDGEYTSGECSGFDDMFPTIDVCAYERFPWKGTPLADHGEVWSLPWIESEEKDGLRLEVSGVRLPYRLEKKVWFPAASTLQVDYRLTNPTPVEMDFLWAAHMMVNISEKCDLVLPEGVRKVVNRLSFNGSMGDFGEEFDWPVFTDKKGARRDLRRMRPESAHDADKYYVKGRMPEGWCKVNYPEEGFDLKVAFPTETVPYLGIMNNERGFDNLYNIFIEPCTASFDRPDVARLRSENSVVKPHSTYEWYLRISIDSIS